jgi:hypothetical protein
LDRRAEKIAEERGWPLPIARSEAAAEMVRMRTQSLLLCCDFARDSAPFAGRFSIADQPDVPSL